MTSSLQSAQLSLSNTLTAISGHLPVDAVSGSVRGRLEAVAARLPADPFNHLYFEYPLQAGPPRLDVSVALDAARIRDVITPLVQTATDEGNVAWRGLASLADGIEHSIPLRTAGRLWMEFDLPALEGAIQDVLPVPGIFVEWRHGATMRASTEEHVARAHSVFTHLGDRRICTVVCESARRAIETLPASAYPHYVGVFVARGAETLRLCLVGLERDAILPYLVRCRWPGDMDAVAHLLHQASRRPRATGDGALSIVNIDVGAEMCPTLGLELAVESHAKCRSTAPVIEWLTEQGWATGVASTALDSWAGTSLVSLPHHLWRSIVTRRVNHVKLTLHATCVEAKVYLAAEMAAHVPQW